MVQWRASSGTFNIYRPARDECPQLHVTSTEPSRIQCHARIVSNTGDDITARNQVAAEQGAYTKSPCPILMPPSRHTHSGDTFRMLARGTFKALTAANMFKLKTIVFPLLEVQPDGPLSTVESAQSIVGGIHLFCEHTTPIHIRDVVISTACPCIENTQNVLQELARWLRPGGGIHIEGHTIIAPDIHAQDGFNEYPIDLS